mmetsp:Transcript_36834/g.89737  ORF Transcript_36834/g.89737 Transcript_36834/m.89737 type:complete len:208 (+) Transcript_36834:1417-2040(+)
MHWCQHRIWLAPHELRLRTNRLPEAQPLGRRESARSTSFSLPSSSPRTPTALASAARWSANITPCGGRRASRGGRNIRPYQRRAPAWEGGITIECGAERSEVRRLGLSQSRHPSPSAMTTEESSSSAGTPATVPSARCTKKPEVAGCGLGMGSNAPSAGAARAYIAGTIAMKRPPSVCSPTAAPPPPPPPPRRGGGGGATPASTPMR